MDFQKMLSGTVSSMIRNDLNEGGCMTVDRLVRELSQHGEKQVAFSDGTATGNLNSYRGYYEHLALSRGVRQVSCAELAAALVACIGKTFSGYKGGDYRMRGDTFVFASEYGTTGDMIVGVRLDGERVVLDTKPED